MALPRRGEARALDTLEAEFLAHGHIHFGDSDEEGARAGAAAATKPYTNSAMARAPASHALAPQARTLPPPPGAVARASARAPGARGPAAPDQAAAGAAPAHAHGGSRAPGAAPEQGAELGSELGPGSRAPTTAAECEALPAVAGAPQPGDVIAYRLLHVGADWAPAVSVWRLGRVRSVVVRRQPNLRD